MSSLITTSDGGFLIGGQSGAESGAIKSEDSKGGNDYWIVKLNADGTKEWDKTVGGSDEDWLYSLIATEDGGYLLGGVSHSGADGEKSDTCRGEGDYWVVKLNADGSKAWDKTFGGFGDEYLTSMITTLDGGYLLGGYSGSDATGDKTEGWKGGGGFGRFDFWVVKLNADGSKAWDKTFGGYGDDVLMSMILTKDGGFLLGGGSESGGGDKTESKGSVDYWILKLNSDGAKAWEKSFGGKGIDFLTALTATPDGGYLLGGWSNSGIRDDKTEASRGIVDYWVVKLNADGSKAWDKTAGGGGNNYLTSLSTTQDGSYLLGGWSNSQASGDKTENTKGSGDLDYWRD